MIVVSNVTPVPQDHPQARPSTVWLFYFKGGRPMTMTPITPTLKLHTHQGRDGIHLNSIIMKHKGNNYHLYAGTRDTIYIFSENIALYVLTVNREHGKIGLNAYMSPEPFPINSFHMHSTKEIKDLFGSNWEQLPALDITLKLINYLI